VKITKIEKGATEYFAGRYMLHTLLWGRHAIET